MTSEDIAFVQQSWRQDRAREGDRSGIVLRAALRARSAAAGRCSARRPEGPVTSVLRSSSAPRCAAWTVSTCCCRRCGSSASAIRYSARWTSITRAWRARCCGRSRRDCARTSRRMLRARGSRPTACCRKRCARRPARRRPPDTLAASVHRLAGLEQRLDVAEDPVPSATAIGAEFAGVVACAIIGMSGGVVRDREPAEALPACPRSRT